MRANSDEEERRRLIASIADEVSTILSTEYGMEGVRIHIDPQTGEIVSSRAIPEHLKPRIIAAASKQAILRRVRESERDLP